MKVKIGSKTYDPNDLPIAIYLTKKEQEHIANMAPDAAIYSQYPEGEYEEDIVEFLEEFRKEMEDVD